MQALDQDQCLEIERSDVVEMRFAADRFNRLGNGFHDDAFP
jgi:hypothetical protein